MEHRHAVNCRFFFTFFFTLKKKKVYFSTQLKTKCPHHRCWLSIRISYWLVKKDPLLNAWKVTHEQHQPWPVPGHAQACISSLRLGGSWINVLDGHLFQVLFLILFTLHTVFEGKFMPSPCTAFSRPSRSIHYRDISGSNRRKTSHFFAGTKWPETDWPPWIMRPRDWPREICFSFSATWMQK